jgi:DNA-binding transcriptional ArsR family regulator
MISRVTLYNKLKPHAGKFHAIGNITRFSILYILAREPMEFKRLGNRLKLSPSLLSHHLKKLVDSGLVTKTQVGRFVTYYVAEDAVKNMSVILGKFLSPQSESLPAMPEQSDGRRGTDIL